MGILDTFFPKAKGGPVKTGRDKYSLMKTNDNVSFYVPYRTMLDDKTLLLKNGGMARIFEIHNKDLSFEDDIDVIIDYLNFMLKQVNSGFVIHFETQKVPIRKGAEKISDFSPLPTRISQYYRDKQFKEKTFYKISHYLTISYLWDYTKESTIDKITNFGNKKNYKKEFNELLETFDNKVKDLMAALQPAIAFPKPLKGSELLNYLYRTINPLVSNVNLAVPPPGFPIDDFLSVSQMFETEGTLKVHDTYTKVISIRLFAKSVIPQIFSRLENLEFPFRSVTRLIGLSKEEAKKAIHKIETFHYGKRFTLVQNILAVFNKGQRVDAGNVNEIMKAYEAKQAKRELEAGDTGYGYYTFTVIVASKNLEVAKNRANIVRREINSNGFTSVDDIYNTKDAYFAAFPGNIKQNVRKAPMDSRSLAHMLPISSVFEGLPWDDRINAPNLITTLAGENQDQLFYLNNKVDSDIGHTMVLGPTGAGKSVFLGALAINFMKYDGEYFDRNGIKQKAGSRVIFFDKGASSKVLTITQGGKFYELGGENGLAFQPLRYIDKEKELEFARDWVLKLIEIQQPDLVQDVKNRDAIFDALRKLAVMPAERRTITNLKKHIQVPILKSALTIYTTEGTYGSYFDNNKDEMENSRIIGFEMGEIMEKPEVLVPMLLYIFHKIEKDVLSLGIPVMIILDEAHVFLKQKMTREKIEQWLKVLRKQNGTIVLATQSLDDIEQSGIAASIKDACATNIFLPNRKAISNYYNLYKQYDLSDIAINTIQKASPKGQYIYNSKYGTRLFSLNLSNVELAYLGASSDIEKAQIDSLEKVYKKLHPEGGVKYVCELNRAYLQQKYHDGYITQADLENSNTVIEKFEKEKTAV